MIGSTDETAGWSRDGELSGGKAARICEVAWSRRRIAMGLVLAIALPCLPWRRGEPLAVPARRAPGPWPTPMFNLVFHPDGQLAATTDDAGRVLFWRAGEDWSPGPPLAVGGHARHLAFSPDGRLAVGGLGLDAMLWELSEPPRGRPLGIPIRNPTQLKFSTDGRMLVVAGSDSTDILLWDLDSGRVRMTLRGHSRPSISMALAPDGRSLASAAGSTAEDLGIRVWDLSTGRLERRIGQRVGAIEALAYSPDSRRLAGASPIERQVRLWDAATCEPVRVIAGHSRPCRSVAFSPDGVCWPPQPTMEPPDCGTSRLAGWSVGSTAARSSCAP